ncbi:uncharacterized protein LOC111402342 [Olea europaea var. sylvestris]|uniref:uncharacterized protein LOC111402342 n=1 Tax=Olea europaea var. sylvestris TaxID=158386 RepID=UPI000C1D1B4E|nr:uncharacterized protein LOC111402342 [Olea europaea var. sylvestris]
MARVMARIPINHRILMCESREIEFSGDPAAINLSDTVFEFLSEECEGLSPVSFDGENEEDGEEEEKNGNGNAEDNCFWETHYQLLQDTLCRTSSLESRIRSITKETKKEAQQTRNFCGCGRQFNNGCRNCLMKEVCRRLQNAGFDGAICKSKWRSSLNIPSGEHTFLDVREKSSSNKGEIRVIIELNFRAEFEMARANEEYNKLIRKLPEFFVGKIERLLALLKILCSAGKKCMKEKKMHMAPWRKHRYMEAKWLRICERLTSTPPLSTGYSGRAARPTASMLTVDLTESFPNLHRTVVEVV